MYISKPQLQAFIYFLGVAFVLTLGDLSLAQAKDLPKKITLTYEVSRDGKPFANVIDNFQQVGKQYHITSVTKGIGIYALFGTRKLSSDGEITDEGLKPNQFELHNGDNAKKWTTSVFDWANKILTITSQVETSTAPLEAGTQDMLSFLYQFMFAPPIQDKVPLSIATGKKLKVYPYQVAARDVALEVPAGHFLTTHLTSTHADDDKEVWLANQQHYLLVRLTMHEKGALLEQNLKSIQIE